MNEFDVISPHRAACRMGQEKKKKDFNFNYELNSFWEYFWSIEGAFSQERIILFKNPHFCWKPRKSK